MTVTHYISVRTYRYKDEEKAFFRIAFVRITAGQEAGQMLEDMEEIPTITEAGTKATKLSYYSGIELLYDPLIYGRFCTRAEAEESGKHIS